MSSRRTRTGIAMLACVLATGVAIGAAMTGCTSRSRIADGASAEPTPAASDSPLAAPPPTDSLAPLALATDAGFETALAPLHDIQVFARLEGEIVGVPVEEGRRVRAGDKLAQLDDRERRATLEMREAELSRAESAWQRAQRLHAQKVISEEQYIAARSDWKIAGAQRNHALIEWERCTVRTPIAGVIEQRRVQMGQMVKEGDLLFRIGNPDTLRAELLLPEARLGTVRVGQSVRVTPAAGGDPTMARVTRVSPLVDPASGTFRVVIDLDNRAGRLHGGVSARVVFDPAPAAPR